MDRQIAIFIALLVDITCAASKMHFEMFTEVRDVTVAEPGHSLLQLESDREVRTHNTLKDRMAFSEEREDPNRHEGLDLNRLAVDSSSQLASIMMEGSGSGDDLLAAYHDVKKFGSTTNDGGLQESVPDEYPAKAFDILARNRFNRGTDSADIGKSPDSINSISPLHGESSDQLAEALSAGGFEHSVDAAEPGENAEHPFMSDKGDDSDKPSRIDNLTRLQRGALAGALSKVVNAPIMDSSKMKTESANAVPDSKSLHLPESSSKKTANDISNEEELIKLQHNNAIKAAGAAVHKFSKQSDDDADLLGSSSPNVTWEQFASWQLDKDEKFGNTSSVDKLSKPFEKQLTAHLDIPVDDTLGGHFQRNISAAVADETNGHSMQHATHISNVPVNAIEPSVPVDTTTSAPSIRANQSDLAIVSDRNIAQVRVEATDIPAGRQSSRSSMAPDLEDRSSQSQDVDKLVTDEFTTLSDADYIKLRHVTSEAAPDKSQAEAVGIASNDDDKLSNRTHVDVVTKPLDETVFHAPGKSARDIAIQQAKDERIKLQHATAPHHQGMDFPLEGSSTMVSNKSTSHPIVNLPKEKLGNVTTPELDEISVYLPKHSHESFGNQTTDVENRVPAAAPSKASGIPAAAPAGSSQLKDMLDANNDAKDLLDELMSGDDAALVKAPVPSHGIADNRSSNKTKNNPSLPAQAVVHHVKKTDPIDDTGQYACLIQAKNKSWAKSGSPSTWDLGKWQCMNIPESSDNDISSFHVITGSSCSAQFYGGSDCQSPIPLFETKRGSLNKFRYTAGTNLRNSGFNDKISSVRCNCEQESVFMSGGFLRIPGSDCEGHLPGTNFFASTQVNQSSMDAAATCRKNCEKLGNRCLGFKMWRLAGDAPYTCSYADGFWFKSHNDLVGNGTAETETFFAVNNEYESGPECFIRTFSPR